MCQNFLETSILITISMSINIDTIVLISLLCVMNQQNSHVGFESNWSLHAHCVNFKLNRKCDHSLWEQQSMFMVVHVVSVYVHFS